MARMKPKRRYSFKLIREKKAVSLLGDVARALDQISQSDEAMARIAKMAAEFSSRFDQINPAPAEFGGKATNPFVLAAHSRKEGFFTPVEILPGLEAAKAFSSYETAVGRAVEDIVPSKYGWSRVRSEGHSTLSEIDVALKVGDTIKLAALKSGPSCINDTMAKRIGTAIAENFDKWAENWSASKVEYSVGMNYSTGLHSNKKDWHAVRIAQQELVASGATVIESCLGGDNEEVALPRFVAKKDELVLEVAARQGIALWDYIGFPIRNVYMEICCALARAVVQKPSELSVQTQAKPADDSGQIFRVAEKLKTYRATQGESSSVISDVQLPWLILFISHYADQIDD